MGARIDLRYWLKKYVDDYPYYATGRYPIFIDENGVEHEEKSPYFESMSAELQKRGYLLKKEFVSIGKWKTERQKGQYESNPKEKVKNITKQAIKAPYEQKIRLLCKLAGVKVPVASAILTVMHPTEYCIIDYRAWRVLLWLHMLAKKPSFQFDSYREYSEFLDRYDQYSGVARYVYFLGQLKKIGQRRDMTPRQVEMAFWKFDESKGEKLRGT